MAAMTEREQARRDSAKIDDHEKEGRKRVHAEMSAEPRQPEGQCRRRRCGATDELEQRGSAGHGADQERAAIDQPPAPCRPAHQNVSHLALVRFREEPLRSPRLRSRCDRPASLGFDNGVGLSRPLHFSLSRQTYGWEPSLSKMRSGVSGRSGNRTPVALATALAIAGATALIAHSPCALAPNGPTLS
jgi:hypothetical protein